jgi:folate-binding protein YgfZ
MTLTPTDSPTPAGSSPAAAPPPPATPSQAPSQPPPRELPDPLHALHAAADAEFQAYDALQIVSTFGEPQAEYAALHKACGLMDLAHRGVIELTGRDRLPFLNNLLTNETWSKQAKTGLAVGRGVYAFLLNVNGRVVTDLNVIERGDRTYLELDARLVAPTLKALDRYLFADQVKLADRVGAIHELALHGPTAAAVLAQAVAADADATVVEGSAVVPALADLPPLGSADLILFGVPVTVWRDDVCGAAGLHLLVPADRVAHVWSTFLARFGELVAHAKRPLRPVGWAAFNTARIEAGRPLFGVDFDATVLPAETGDETFARAVSTTKGCYPGQEIVARMFARKQSAKQLVGLRVEGDALPLAGAGVFDDAGNQVGGVTSSTVSPLSGRAAVAFALVKKPFAVDGKVVTVPAEGAMRKAVVSKTLRFLKPTSDA